VCVSGAVTLAAYFLSRLFMGRDHGKLRERLAGRRAETTKKVASGGRAQELFQRIGTAAAKPFMPDSREKMSELRKKLSRAGIYSSTAFKMVTGMKLICLLVGLIGGYIVGAMLDNLMLGLSLGGLAGYMTPAIWLSMQIRKQQQELEYGLPDALDLSKEMEITHLETRVGLSRADALKNMGQRTGNAALQSLASMLIQAERFGTSIAGALRIHGESLRSTRQFKAEEMAAKASVKMSFPLVLFIFPATFLILAGPTVIGLMNSPFFKDQ
jgi:tight adherence protein C